MKAAPETLSPGQAAFLVRQRVARLATADATGTPHVVPVCFACSPEGTFYVALDEKPKDVPPTRLKRVRNILENPRVALVADRYAEDWSLLAFVLVRGSAGLLEQGTGEHADAVRLLRGKYHQYEEMPIEDNPVISIKPERVASWGALAARSPALAVRRRLHNGGQGASRRRDGGGVADEPGDGWAGRRAGRQAP